MNDPWPRDLAISAVTYTVNYFNAFHGHPTTSIAHAWSLAVEEQFYLLWPLLFILLARRQWLVRGLIATAGAALAWRSILVWKGAPTAYLYNAFDTRMDCLAVGCLLAVVWQRITRFEVASRRAWYPLITVAALIASRAAPSQAYHYSLGFTVEALLCALLLVQLMHLSPVSGWRFLDHPVMRFLGAISYPMYLYHALGGAFGRRIPGSNRTIEFIGTIVATVIIAAGSYYVIEKPFLRLRGRKGRRAPGIAAA
jgi:peptidoglycan/LPS O-acetylase OafA/YrhL